MLYDRNIIGSSSEIFRLSSKIFGNYQEFSQNVSLRSKRFRGVQGQRITAWKRGERERGRGRKETLADKPLDFENCPLCLSCLTDFMLSSSIRVAFVILVLARFEILDHCIFLSNKNHARLPRCQRVFLYFCDEAAIVSGKATHQNQRFWILSKHCFTANN